jgi:hypothetical protein
MIPIATSIEAPEKSEVISLLKISNPAMDEIEIKMYNKTKDVIGVGEYLCQMKLQTRW